MNRSLALFLAPVLLLAGCGGDPVCAPPHANWTATAANAADTVSLDSVDTVRWNGTIISLERLRGTLIEADAKGHPVLLSRDPAASCAMVEKLRLSMEQSLSCGQGRCGESVTP